MKKTTDPTPVPEFDDEDELLEDSEFPVDDSVVKIKSTGVSIESLMEDWFERDGETFTRVGDSHRLDWEKELEEDDSYSVFIAGDITLPDMIRRAYPLARNMILSMGIEGRITLRLNKDTSATDGRVVYVSTQVFDEKEYSPGERLDVFLGLAIHEGCHVKYTDFKDVLKPPKKSPMPSSPHGLSPGEYRAAELKIIHQISNLLEDERIEQLLGEELPGLTKFLAKTKYFYFDKLWLDMKLDETEKLNPFERLFSTLHRIIRFPRYLKREDFEFFGKYLIDVKAVLTPYPDSTKEAVIAAYKIFDIFKEFYEHPPEVPEVPPIFGGGGEGEEEGEGEIPSGVSDEKIGSDMVKDSEKIVDKIAKLFESTAEAGGTPDIKESKALAAEPWMPGELEGKLARGRSKETFFHKVKDKRAEYQRIKDKVSIYIAPLARALEYKAKDYKIIHKGMRHGYLDPNKLVEARQGVATVYQTYGEVKTDSICVGLLLDQSGSMSGDRIKKAQEAAILLREALKRAKNIQRFIYGHSGDMMTDQATELYIYEEPGYDQPWALGDVRAYSENRDGIAILETCQRIRQFTQRAGLLFVLADGAPSATDYHGASARAHTRRCVKQAEAMNFQIVQVCINSSYDPKEMFSHYITLEELETLPRELGKVIKKAAERLSVVRIS